MNQIKQISPTTAGFLFGIASAALFAIRPIFVKLVYALVLLLRNQATRAKINIRLMMSTSVVGLFGYYAASFLDLVGLQYVTTQLGRMILYVYPTMVVVLGVILFREKITWRTLASLAITYSGVLIIFSHDLNQFGSDIIKGALFILGSALSFAIYLIFSKPLIAQLGSRVFTCIALLSASIGIFIHYAFSRSITAPEVNAIGLFWILVIAIFCTVIPTFFTTAAVARIGPNKTGIVAMVGPAFTSTAAILVLNELFTMYHALGITITVLGVWYLHRESRSS